MKLFSAYKICLLMAFLSFGLMHAQTEKIRLFKLQDVQLTESPFRKAMLTDLHYMKELEPDRLLAPFLKEAGLDPKAENYPNWENTGLDGHIAGHYLTALAQMFASTGDQEALDRLKYMLDELKKVQEANGNGYIGGVPGSKELWKEIANGQIDAGSFSLNDRWVPLYNIHKTYAGLRDAYEIAGLEQAKEMLIDFTDWMIEETKNLSKEQIQEMLKSEHGGLNEVFADVARITGDRKYLDLAYNFSQKALLKPMEDKKDILNGMHANTQIPKVIGFETISEVDGNKDYHDAATYFWNNVVNERTVAIGGNSVREHFNPADDFSSMINSVQGPETCNTYNMLKLTEKLFEAHPEEKYSAYYEKALYNHILSSQHPDTGGFVYFTPMRPEHYRVYSQPETSFWCCVGSGMENHGKYNEFIYAHTNEDLYVNLFIPSILTWKDKNLRLIQQTNFPEEQSTSLTLKLEKPQQLNLMLRYPSWVNRGEYRVLVNGKPVDFKNEAGSYVSVKRRWKNADKVEIKLPMHISSEALPDGSDYNALEYGPIVLGAKTGEKDLKGLYADASRGGHIPEGKKIPLSETPLFLNKTSQDISQFVQKADDSKLQFSASEILYPAKFKKLEFVPFYKIHDSRYVIYLPVETPESLAKIEKKGREEEVKEQKLEVLTIDKVAPGEQQPESDHFIKSENSNIGVNQDRHWRDASGWFSYELKNNNHEAEKVRITYFGLDSDRKFRIYVNDILIAEENLDGSKGYTFFTEDYMLPKEVMAENSEKLTVRFEAMEGFRTAGIYGVRLMKKE
ncbi:glycosyl hydrolase [Christiangramia fulva]|uniref:Glycosyl hydrolase n=1 Tax=Christiangramia fulva TaxID=2126553 RepID=A0A2R3Z7H2_9FLAO|nr:glycoside hydrolase family 127 protein [Christiangramia fulva]AVR46223.1 glycosyl hydrolase [Christiangramia fulva]